jgi:hypothetical protein
VGGTVPVIYMNSLICEPTTCTAVVGNVLVYFDDHHLTQAYALTLTPYLSAKLMGALAKVLPATKQAAAEQGAPPRDVQTVRVKSAPRGAYFHLMKAAF